MKTLREKIAAELSYHLPNLADRDRATERVLQAIEQDEGEKHLVDYIANIMDAVDLLSNEDAAAVLLTDAHLKIEWVN